MVKSAILDTRRSVWELVNYLYHVTVGMREPRIHKNEVRDWGANHETCKMWSRDAKLRDAKLRDSAKCPDRYSVAAG